MLRLCLCILAGAYSLSLFRQLPADSALVVTCAVTLACIFIRRVRPLGWALFGLVLLWFSARSVLQDRLPLELQGQTLSVTVRVVDFPESLTGSVRFLVETVDDQRLPARLRLTWYDAADLPRIGETWKLEVRLRRPRGFANDTGFDYELWLTRQRIGATGYVVADPRNGRVEGAGIGRSSRLRQELVDRIVAVTGEGDASAVLLAITVGARHLISKDQWERYAVSGTSHLMAISGLHIGLAASGAWLLARLLFPLVCRSVNIRDLAAATAVLAACAYAEISGFAVPAQRATLMALLVMGTFVLRRQLSSDNVIGLSCLVIVASDPLAIHSPGFKLSFGAVAILLWTARHRYHHSGPQPSRLRTLATGVRRLSALQVTLLLGLFPLTVLIFGRVSWLAPMINLLVLPLFNLVTVPAALVGLLLDGPLSFAGDLLLRAAWHSVRLTLWLIALASDWPPARLHIASVTAAMLPVVLLAALWALLPPAFPGRKLAFIAALSALLYKPPPPPHGCVDLVALEVGQGLSLVLRTARRTLIYDTGPSFRSGTDVGQLVLVPWLRSNGIQTVDLLVVSHSDDDHAGGARSLARSIEVSQIMAGERLARITAKQLRCRSGQAWFWDGVRFSVMHPGTYPLQSNNNASCVLEVAAGPYKILLTGDIESPVENHLARIGALTPVDIVMVPHHGSSTSSAKAFVDAVQPSVAIVSSGYGNRWGFPKAEVAERWHSAGARLLNTATSGAIHFRVCQDSGPDLGKEQRIRLQRYWHDPPEPAAPGGGKNF